MRILATAIALLATVSWAHAISRHSVGGWTCARVKATLQSEGAAILRYPSTRNPSLTLYDRYVLDTRWCQPGQVFKNTSIPTADTKVCPVRKCIEYDPPDMR
jgi:hypothetical protein